MRQRSILILVAACLLVAGCEKDKWIQGRWLLITPEGKPGVCHEFLDGGVFNVFTTPDCSGEKDTVLSGKWELKDDKRLALLRYNERKASVAHLAQREKAQFRARGALTGTLYKLDPPKTTAQALLKDLTEQGVIKVRELPEDRGCAFLDYSVEKAKALPKEDSPRMLRFKDTKLKYFSNSEIDDPRVEKVVYAVNYDEIDWVALHLTESAFNPPGPQSRLEEVLGPPDSAAATGAGEKRQHIAMWRAYCGMLNGVARADVDVTLFATTGQRRGTIYVSEGVVSSLWEDLMQMARNQPPPSDDLDGDSSSPADQEPPPIPEPAASAAAEPPSKTAPAAHAPAPAPPEPAAAAPKPAAPKPAAPRTGTAAPPPTETGALPGDEDL